MRPMEKIKFTAEERDPAAAAPVTDAVITLAASGYLRSCDRGPLNDAAPSLRG